MKVFDSLRRFFAPSPVLTERERFHAVLADESTDHHDPFVRSRMLEGGQVTVTPERLRVINDDLEIRSLVARW